MRGSLIAAITGVALLAFSPGAFAQDARVEKGASFRRPEMLAVPLDRGQGQLPGRAR